MWTGSARARAAGSGERRRERRRARASAGSRRLHGRGGRLGRRRSGDRDGRGLGRRRRGRGKRLDGLAGEHGDVGLRQREPQAVEPANEPLDLELVDGDVGLEAERHGARLADEIAEIGAAGRARDRERRSRTGPEWRYG